jgi:hypothetical protein
MLHSTRTISGCMTLSPVTVTVTGYDEAACKVLRLLGAMVMSLSLLTQGVVRPLARDYRI